MSKYRDAWLFVFLSLAWGGSFAAIEVGLDALPPVFFAAVRYDFGAVLLVGYAAATTAQWRPRTRGDLISIGVVGAFIIAANNALLFVGQQYTTSAAAAIIYSLIPVLTTVFARALLPEERLSSVGVLGLLVGLAGVVLVVRPDPNHLSTGTLGKLLVVTAAACVALGSVVVRRVDTAADSTATTGWAMVLGAAIMHAVSLGFGEAPRAGAVLSRQALVSLLYLGVIATAGAYATYFGLLERHGPIEINLVSYASPMVAAVVGWLLLGESLASTTVIGFGAILVGFVLIKRTALATLASPR